MKFRITWKREYFATVEIEADSLVDAMERAETGGPPKDAQWMWDPSKPPENLDTIEEIEG
jgi:hypothetical protein